MALPVDLPELWIFLKMHILYGFVRLCLSAIFSLMVVVVLSLWATYQSNWVLAQQSHNQSDGINTSPFISQSCKTLVLAGWPPIPIYLKFVFDNISKSNHSYNDPPHDSSTNKANLDVSTPQSILDDLKNMQNINKNKVFISLYQTTRHLIYLLTDTLG